MIVPLRVLFSLVLVSMLAVTGWASLQCNIFKIPGEVVGHPWFIATLFDTYFGFLTFYVWVAYKETTILARIVWFVLIMLLGNIAMASYMLIALARLPADADAATLLLRGQPANLKFGKG